MRPAGVDLGDLERQLRLDRLLVAVPARRHHEARHRLLVELQHADLVLPAAGWGEKEGTFINSERRIGLIHRVKQAPGQALADFFIFKLIAEAWGCADLFEAWRSPEDVFRILGRLSKGQPCDISGLSGYEEVARLGGVQWPYPEGFTLPPAGTPVADGSGENIFVIRDGVVHTPALGASILGGITRDSVMAILREFGMPIVERPLARDELYVADEVFMVGTAAEVTPVREIDDRIIGIGARGPVTARVQSRWVRFVSAGLFFLFGGLSIWAALRR